MKAPLQRDALVALAALAGQLALLAHGGLGVGQFHRLDVRGGLLAAVSTLPLVVWRRRPLAVFVLTTLASATLNALHYPAGPPLGATIALFLFAATTTEPKRRTVVIVAALLAIHVSSVAVGDHSFPTAQIGFGLLIWTVTLFAGDRVRLRHERGERGRRLAAAEERTRIARDLHDSVGHALNVILVQAGAARLLRERDPDRSQASLETIEEVARQTVVEIDQLVRTLRENGDGRVEAQPGLASLDTLVAQHRLAGLAISVDRRGAARHVPTTVDQAAYRILQEALTNAARHGLGEVDVTVVVGAQQLELTVRNRIPPADAGEIWSNGHGLIGMRERAALLGGSLTATAESAIFTVRAILPAEGAA